MPEILTDAYLLFTFVFKQALNRKRLILVSPTLISYICKEFFIVQPV